MLQEQGGKCAICQSAHPGRGWGRLMVDHCHATKKVRGLLCYGCNTAIAQFKEDPQVFARAVAYLKGESPNGAP
jgi:hypothetical protein